MKVLKFLVMTALFLNGVFAFAENSQKTTETPVQDIKKDDSTLLNFDESTLEAIRRMGIGEDLIRRMGSGDIAGNGGGRIEADFHYIYGLLPKLIKDCQKSPVCPVNEEDKKILEDIWVVTVVNSIKKNKLIFLNESSSGNLFFDEDDQQVRVAVTGFERHAPIFINLDLVYKDQNNIESMGRIIQILIHEVGHQTGIRSHAHLDEIGGKLRNFFLRESIEVFTDVENQRVRISNINFRSPYTSSEVLMSWEHHRIGISYFDISEKLKRKVACKGAGRDLVSFKVSNLHWGRKKIVDGEYKFPLKGWIDLKCSDKNTVLWTEEADFSILFKMGFVNIPPGRILMMKDWNLSIAF